MARMSLSAVWDDSRGFIAREWPLLLPVAFATIGVGATIFSLATPVETASGMPPPGPWMLWMIPYAVLVLLGSLTISALVLRPGSSVGEALALGARRLGGGLLFGLLLGVMGVLALMAAALVAALIARPAGLSIYGASVLTLLVALPALVAINVRLLLTIPDLIDRGVGAPAAMRRSVALTRGLSWRLFGLLVAAAVTMLVLTMAVQFTLGTLLTVLGNALGGAEVSRQLVALLGAALGSVLQMVLVVYLALLYRRVSGASSGT